MKKFIALFLGIILTVGLFACAQAETVAEAPALPEWMELSADDTVLTVRLPLEDPADQSWRYILSFDNRLELITSEIIGDEEGETGEPMWVASFMGTFERFGSVMMQMTLDSKETGHIKTHIAEVFIREDNTIEVVSVSENSWYWLDAEESVLHVSLPSNPSTGFAWTYEISDEEVLVCKGEELVTDVGETLTGAPGVWNAEFWGTFEKAGFVDLKLNYARSWEQEEPAETHTVKLFVNEANYLFLQPEE